MKKPQVKKLLLINSLIIITVFAALISFGKNETMTVNAMAMNIRTGPGVENDVMAQVKRGETLMILKEENQWYQVKFSGNKTGWVASWLIDKGDASPATNIAAEVNTAGTKLRQEANTESKELRSLKKGTKVVVTSEQNGWSQVTVGKKEGWIFSELLSIVTKKEKQTEALPLDQLFARQDDTKVRAEPKIESNPITSLAFGESVTFIESVGDWYKVETQSGKSGYVASWVVNFDKLDATQKKRATSIAETTIVLDPGHGGSDVGAQSNDQTISEKVITLATTNYVQAELEKLGANVILTRSSDVFIDLADIVLTSNRARADAFISFHYDSTETSNQASGFTTYYYKEADLKLATMINQHLEQELPLPNRGVDMGDYQVIRENERPSLLLELGYMNNDFDAHTFKTKKYQRSVAKAIAEGLVAYFGE